VDALFVTHCFVNEGPRWKRMRPAPMGRGFRYQKRTSHIEVAFPSICAAVTERAAAAAAEAQASKGVKGAVRKARKPSRTRERIAEEEEVAGGQFGAENTSVRVSAGLQQGLEVALVREEGLCRPAARRRDPAQAAEGALKSAGVELDRHRARREQAGRANLHRAPGNHHRPQGLGNRQAEGRSAEAHQARSAHRHSGSAPSRNWPRTLVAESIALQLEKRVAFRRAMRKAVDSALRFGCKGIKVRVAGRLNGAEIARKEWYLQGRCRCKRCARTSITGTAEAHTTYGSLA
jgi:hypothetical protein